MWSCSDDARPRTPPACVNMARRHAGIGNPDHGNEIDTGADRIRPRILSGVALELSWNFSPQSQCVCTTCRGWYAFSAILRRAMPRSMACRKVQRSKGTSRAGSLRAPLANAAPIVHVPTNLPTLSGQTSSTDSVHLAVLHFSKFPLFRVCPMASFHAPSRTALAVTQRSTLITRGRVRRCTRTLLAADPCFPRNHD